MKNCPECQSDQFKKLSLIHAEGISSNISAGVGVSSGGVGVGVAKGKSISDLAASCAPPKSMKEKVGSQAMALPIFATFIPFLIASQGLRSFSDIGWYWYALMIAGFVWSSVRSHRAEKAYLVKFKEEMDDYEQSYMCTRCGTHFKPFANG